MECPDISMSTVYVRPSMTIRNNAANDYRLKTDDNGNGSEMIYEHPLTRMINFPFFLIVHLVDRLLLLLTHFSNQAISLFLNAHEFIWKHRFSLIG